MRDESEVLLVERRLLVRGTIAASTYERIKGGLPARGGGTTVCCFVGFAYADLPIGKTFDRVFSRTDHRCTRRALSIIRAVTLQFGQAFDEVPHGWKTICLLDFPDDMPYYIAKEKVRKNIVEHKHGTPLALRLAVVDAATCAPLAGATVDIWHCDAAGVYSGFGSASTGGAQGGAPGGPPPGGTPPAGTGGSGPGNAGPTDKLTFLRGVQRTDARGECAFDTIYPGWYRGRTVHIHVKAHLGGTVVHTGQLFFADSLTDQVYQTGVYKARAAARDTRNSADSIYASGGAQSTLAMKRTATGGYVGTITLGVRRS